MADDLSSAITDAAGQPATVRVGTVTRVNPLQVSVGGTPLNMDAVGVLGSSSYALGMPVALLGQAVKGGDTSGASWLVLGSINTGGSGGTPAAEIRNPFLQNAANATVTPIVWSNAVRDNSGFLAVPGGFNINMPFTGLYDMRLSIQWDTPLGGTTGSVNTVVSVGAGVQSYETKPVSPDLIDTSGVLADQLTANAGDQLHVDVFQSTGVARDFNATLKISFIGSL